MRFKCERYGREKLRPNKCGLFINYIGALTIAYIHLFCTEKWIPWIIRSLLTRRLIFRVAVFSSTTDDDLSECAGLFLFPIGGLKGMERETFRKVGDAWQNEVAFMLPSYQWMELKVDFQLAPLLLIFIRTLVYLHQNIGVNKHFAIGTCS